MPNFSSPNASRHLGRRRRLSLLLALATAAAVAGAGVGPGGIRIAGATNFGYKQTDLVTNNQAELATLGYPAAVHSDSNLVNPWGIAVGHGAPLRVADNGAGLATAYDGMGVAQNPTITIPVAHGGSAGATIPAPVTGVAVNRSSGFVVSGPGGSGPAEYLFVTEDGTVAGWNRTADVFHAITMVDNANFTTGPVYKGAAVDNGSRHLYATNFRAGTIDVFDQTFTKVVLGTFTDPNALAGYGPFGIANIGGLLYVTYAQQDPAKHDDVAGAGKGYVDVFDAAGNFQRRLATGGTLNSPWGLAVATRHFGEFSRDVLVGNFGDGTINAFDPKTDAFVGQLTDPAGKVLSIDGLWGLAFGGRALNADPNTLYFTAGINNETDGLFGSLASPTNG